MSQIYSDPSLESESYSLPNVEVFYADYFLPTVDNLSEEQQRKPGSESIGWYWWACFPGCLPDGDATGPFKTEAEAIADAQEVQA